MFVKIDPSGPVWYQPEAPIGSALRYISSLSRSILWVGAYLQTKKETSPKLKASFGQKPATKPAAKPIKKALITKIPILNSAQKRIGQIEIWTLPQSKTLLNDHQLELITQVVRELGQYLSS